MDNLNMGNIDKPKKNKTIVKSQLIHGVFDLVKNEPMEKVLTDGVFDKTKMKELIKKKLNEE